MRGEGGNEVMLLVGGEGGGSLPTCLAMEMLTAPIYSPRGEMANSWLMTVVTGMLLPPTALNNPIISQRAPLAPW